MTQRGLRLLGLVTGLVALGLWIAWQLGVSLRLNGRLLYTIDDAYIHMAMARNLAEHATYGLVPSVFSSASSSPLWTVLMGHSSRSRRAGCGRRCPSCSGSAARWARSRWSRARSRAR